jgi:hypothetical protein
MQQKDQKGFCPYEVSYLKYDYFSVCNKIKTNEACQIEKEAHLEDV